VKGLEVFKNVHIEKKKEYDGVCGNKEDQSGDCNICFRLCYDNIRID